MPRAGHGLSVYLNSRLVGQMTREASGAVDFRYDATWLAWEHTLPISLSLPLREDRYIGARVLAVFDNLLPDDEGLRRQVAERVGAEGIDPYSLLAALGRDCVGALQFLPESAEAPAAGIVDGTPANDEDIARILSGLSRNPLGIERGDAFRISIAGAQEKTAFLRWDGRWLRPVGSTPTTHIFKPQIGRLPNGLDLSNSVENEYLCLKILRALGLPAAGAEMATFGDTRVLVVERFDRLITADRRLIRVPQEDCYQALGVPWTRKYETEGGPGIPDILKLLSGSDMSADDQRQFLKAAVAFWLLGATDGHAKNFSVFLSPGGGYRMTPLYDVVSAEPSLAAHQLRRNQMKLAMAAGERRHYRIADIAPRHFVESARKGGIGRAVAAAAIDELSATGEAALDQVLACLPAAFPDDLANAVGASFRHRLARLPEIHAGAAS